MKRRLSPDRDFISGARDSARKYPVIVFIHGDSFEWSSGNPYDGSVLASYGNVVVVTINYRLGILGFLNVNPGGEPVSPSNYGLMDQIAALHWLQENVAQFGGDPSNVTLLGHGTGAASVNWLMASRAVPDGRLFHRVILMSGAALSPWALVRTPARFASQVARHVNCSPDLPHAHLLKCLRERPLSALLSTPIQPPDFSSAFGPSIDGVVIDAGEPPDVGDGSSGGGGGIGGGGPGGGPLSMGGGSAGGGGELLGGQGNVHTDLLLRKDVVAKLARYDLLIGVVKAEAYFAFTGEDVQYGIEAERRSKLLRTFVRSAYRYHLSEILATIVNEYTEWERPVQHPVNIRDETLEALSDAQVIAPVVQTAELHSANHRNSYLYVFDYQTKYGDYPQRQGCIHGEELPYLFGAPLVGGFSHFPRNFTKAEVLLSEATIVYWANFARTGNPNEPQEPDLVSQQHGSGARQERNRFKNIEWTAYESVHKKYLSLDTKPKVKSHYRAHRLSFWLNLVPDLHRPGGDEVPASHHELPDDGAGGGGIPVNVALNPLLASAGRRSTARPSAASAIPASTISPNPQEQHHTGNSTLAPSSGGGSISVDDSEDAAMSGSGSPPSSGQEDGFAAYSTALSVTIAIGCSLLILNVLIFAGVYYQRDKTRLGGPASSPGPSAEWDKKQRQGNGQVANTICGDLLADTASVKLAAAVHAHHHHHHHPPPDFDLASSASNTLPRPPPPPKLREAEPLLQHNVHALAASGATLKRKPSTVVVPPVPPVQSTQNSQNTEAELRV